MRLARALVVAASLALGVTAAGCLDYREHLSVNQDGSGTLRVEFVVDLGFMAEIARAMGEKPESSAMQGPTRAEILQQIDVKGIEVKELTVQKKGTKSRVQMLVAFKDLAALQKLEGFGDDRRVEFFEGGPEHKDKAWVVYAFDTKDVIPLEEFSAEEPQKDRKPDPVETKIREITERARAGLKFRATVTLPGKVHASNGEAHPKEPKPNERHWIVDKERDAKRHARLGRGKVFMRLLVDKSALPFVKSFRPAPKKDDKKDKED